MSLKKPSVLNGHMVLGDSSSNDEVPEINGE